MNQIISIYRSTLKPREVEELVDLLIYRPLGFITAWPLRNTFISPNFVTILSVISGFISAWFISRGNTTGSIWGTILFAFSNVLDCTDGQLARLKQQFSPFGRIFDGVADYLVGLAAFLAVGVSWKPDTMTNQNWWTLVVVGGIASTALQGMFLNHVRQTYLLVAGYTKRTDDELVEDGHNHAPLWKKIFLLPFLALYQLYRIVEKIVCKSVILPDVTVDRKARPRRLTIALLLWNFTGKGTHVTLFCIFLLMKRPDLYCWVTLIYGNLWVLIALTYHRTVVALLKKGLEAKQ